MHSCRMHQMQLLQKIERATISAALKPDMADELSAFISAASNAAIAED